MLLIAAQLLSCQNIWSYALQSNYRVIIKMLLSFLCCPLLPGIPLVKFIFNFLKRNTLRIWAAGGGENKWNLLQDESCNLVSSVGGGEPCKLWSLVAYTYNLSLCLSRTHTQTHTHYYLEVLPNFTEISKEVPEETGFHLLLFGLRCIDSKRKSMCGGDTMGYPSANL